MTRHQQPFGQRFRGPTRGVGALTLAILLSQLSAAPSSAQLSRLSSPALVGDPPISGNSTLFGLALAFGDFDCDGFTDLAVGIPLLDAPGSQDSVASAGGVRIFRGDAQGLDGTFTTLFEDDLAHDLAVPEPGDEWGERLVAGNFDGDEVSGLPCDDLAVSGSKENVGSKVNAGAFFVVFGDPLGLDGTRAQAFHQGSQGVRGAVESGDGFGETMVAADFDGDGYDDLVVGAPGEDINSPNEGAVWVFRGSALGLTTPNLSAGDSWVQLLYQDLSAVHEAGASDDKFGAALAACDIDDDGYDDLAVGVPGEDVLLGGGTVTDAGGFHVFFGSANGLRLSDDSFEPGGEEGGAMGTALVGGEFKNQNVFDAGCEIAAGQPGADLFVGGRDSRGDINAAGRVTLHEPQRSGTSGTVFRSLDKLDAGEFPAPNEHLGNVLAAGDFDGDAVDEVVAGVSRDGGSLDQGAIAWLSVADSVGEIYRIGDLTSEISQTEGLLLGLALAAGDLGSQGVAGLAAGIPGLDRDGVDKVGGALLVPAAVLFVDGFESGDVSAWQ